MTGREWYGVEGKSKYFVDQLHLAMTTIRIAPETIGHVKMGRLLKAIDYLVDKKNESLQALGLTSQDITYFSDGLYDGGTLNNTYPDSKLVEFATKIVELNEEGLRKGEVFKASPISPRGNIPHSSSRRTGRKI